MAVPFVGGQSEVILRSCWGSGALGRVKPSPEVMQLVKEAEFEPRSVETSEHCLLQSGIHFGEKASNPVVDLHPCP